ncbi:hypothetical protein ABPG72_015016 [Tetrahymena utriculariae]
MMQTNFKIKLKQFSDKDLKQNNKFNFLQALQNQTLCKLMIYLSIYLSFKYYLKNSLSQDESIQFFQSILQQDIYSELIENPQYHTQNDSAEIKDLCFDIQDTYLSKGLVSGFQIFFSLQEQINNFLFQQDESKSELLLLNLQKDFNLKNTFLLSECLIISTNALDQFILTNYQKHFDLVNTLQKILIFVQVAFLISSIIFAQLYLIQKIASEMKKTLNYFEIFNIDTLIQNPYILSFMKKYKQKH